MDVMIFATARQWGILLGLFCCPVWAGLPDPVALGVAAEVGNVKRITQWLDEGMLADFEADRIGTGLMIGAWEGNIALMEVFLARGANVNFVNRWGEQALQLAAWKGQGEAVRWLLDHGAEVSRQRKEWSALHYAVFAGHQDIARLLMSRGGDINARSPNGSSVLMMAAREGQENLARLLLEAGADPKAVNDAGESALNWAMRQGHYGIAKQVAQTPARFAEAVKASSSSTPEHKPVRSELAPPDMLNILVMLREAEAAKKSTKKLQNQLSTAIKRSKQRAVQTPSKPKSLVITAHRGSGKTTGERVELRR